MNDFVVNGDMFGRYVKIPTGHSKEMHTYKVVSRIESNGYCETPIMFPATAVLHPRVVPVLNVIHCGIDESRVIRVALADCEIVPTIEVEPVKHGRWVETEDGEWECTNCKDAVVICVCGKDVTRHKAVCPNCGAKMDGGAENA